MEKTTTTAKSKSGRYIEGIGRRKTAVARVRVFPGSTGGITVNGRTLAEYFPLAGLKKSVESPIKAVDFSDKFSLSAKVTGGGQSAQAEAIRHGLSRALVKINPEFRGRLKALGYLKRDPRMVERKKYGLKKARRSPQWAKR